MRIHITGASGSGTTTLGRALAAHLDCAHLDGDDYYWLATTPPYQQARDPSERLSTLLRDVRAGPAVVVSGSLVGWGAEIEDAFDLVVFLYLPVDLRIERLRRREESRFGAADPAFLEWAAQYDQGPPEGRSLAKHNAWLAARKCPVLRLEEDLSVVQRVERVRDAIARKSLHMDAHRYNVFGRIFLIRREEGRWQAHAVGADGKRSPAGFVVPDFIEEAEMEQFLYDLFHESATPGNGDVRRID